MLNPHTYNEKLCRKLFRAALSQQGRTLLWVGKGPGRLRSNLGQVGFYSEEESPFSIHTNGPRGPEAPSSFHWAPGQLYPLMLPASPSTRV